MFIVQDDYPVGILDCFEPVGNGNDGASFNQRVDGFLHLHFIFWVERGGSFVHHRVVALRQAHDEVVATGFLGGGNDFLVRCIRLAETDVVAYGVLKQIDILEHHRDGYFVHRYTAKEDAALLWVVETGAKFYHRAFSTTRRAYKSRQ